MKNLLKKMGKNWVVFAIFGFMLMPYLGAWILSVGDVRSHIVITDAEIQERIQGADSDQYVVEFSIENHHPEKSVEVEASVEVGVSAPKHFLSGGIRSHRFETLARKFVLFQLAPLEKKKIAESLSVNRKDYAKAIGASSLPGPKITIQKAEFSS